MYANLWLLMGAIATCTTMATGGGDTRAHGGSDSIITEFATYEDFLDSQITPRDLYYLEVSDLRVTTV